MFENHNRTNLKADHCQYSDSQLYKRSLLLSLTIFMAWVAGIGLLFSLIACQPVQSKPIATNTNNGYYIDLSKLNSGKPAVTLWLFLCLIIAQPLKLSLCHQAPPQKRIYAPQGVTPSYL